MYSITILDNFIKVTFENDSLALLLKYAISHIKSSFDVKRGQEPYGRYDALNKKFNYNKPINDSQRVYYIVYNYDLKIVYSSKFYEGEVDSLQRQEGHSFINLTNPKNKDLIKKINLINKTNF